MVVVIQDGGGRVARHVDVDPAVAVEVRGHGGHGVPAGDPADAGRLGHVRESAVARVAKQQVGVGRQASGPTVHRHALPQAVGTLSHFRSAGQVEPEVVCDEQIDAPVTVVVDERATGSPSRRAGREARGARDVLERAVAAIVIQHVLSVVGHREVDEAVVVVVAGTDARRPPDGVQPGAGGDVREGAVPVVVIEVRPRRRSRAGRPPISRVPSCRRTPLSTSASGQPSLS